MIATARTVIVSLFTIAVFSGTAHAATLDSLHEQVKALLAQIALIQQAGSTAQTSVSKASTPSTQCPTITGNLFKGAKGTDVTQLQQFLTRTLQSALL